MFLEYLNILNDVYDMTDGAIAKELAFAQNSISRIRTGVRAPSRHAIISISLLVEVKKLRLKIEQITAAQRTLAQLSAPSSPFLVNESGVPDAVSSSPETPGKVVIPTKYKVPRAKPAHRTKTKPQ